MLNGFILRIVFNYPRAFFRWLIFNKEEEYQHYFENTSFNYIVSMIIITSIILLFHIVFN